MHNSHVHCEVLGGDDGVRGALPSVRPPPFTGAIPSDSFFRKSISVWTSFPSPRAPVFKEGPLLVSDPLPPPLPRIPPFLWELGTPVDPTADIDPDVLGMSQPSIPSSSSELISIVPRSFDPLATAGSFPFLVLLLSVCGLRVKSKSSKNVCQLFPAPKSSMSSSSVFDDKRVWRRSASVSLMSSNSSSEPSPAWSPGLSSLGFGVDEDAERHR